MSENLALAAGRRGCCVHGTRGTMNKTIGVTGLKKILFAVFVVFGYIVILRDSVNVYSQVSDDYGKVIINQFYGRADDLDVAVSHSFIELYNTTDGEISLDGWSLQYSAGYPRGERDDEWHVLPLNGNTVGAYGSLLVVGKPAPVTKQSDIDTFNKNVRYTITGYDVMWDVTVSNRSVTLAVVKGLDPLSPVITPEQAESVVDLVGAANSYSETGDRVLNWQGSFINGISKQKSARRIFFLNTGDNRFDFEILDYRESGMSDEMLAEKRPRWSGDGDWGRGVEPPEIIPENQRLVFSAEAGIYDEAFGLVLSTGYTKGVIRYTLDGSDPVPGSKEYGAPIEIKDRTGEPNVLSAISNISGDGYTPVSSPVLKGNVVKAQVFAPDGTPLTGIYTKSYFVSLNAQLSGIAVLSVVTERDNFFDDEIGIYVNTKHDGVANYDRNGPEWERPVHLEFIEPDGTVGFSQDAGVRLNGSGMRGHDQKSMRFYASASRDPDNPRFDYDVFRGGAKTLDGREITSFRRLIARNGGNDCELALMRDVVGQNIAEGTLVPYQSARPVIMFLNGEFWGLYYLRERIDEYFVRDVYGMDSADNIVVISNIGLDETTWEYKDWDDFPIMKWFRDNPDFSSPEKYAQACLFIDADNFIDYNIVQTYVANTDWPSNNNIMWRYDNGVDSAEPGAEHSPEDGRFRWILKDLDFAIWTRTASNAIGNWWRSGRGVDYDYDYIARILDTDFQHYEKRNDNWATVYFRRLITNKGFADKFVNRYCDLMNTDLNANAVIPMIYAERDAISDAVPQQRARWRLPYSGWAGYVEDIVTFFDYRQEYTIEHLRDNFGLGDDVDLNLKTDKLKGYININGIDILPGTGNVSDPGNWRGIYFAGMEQTVTAVPYPGHIFTGFYVNGRKYTENPLEIALTGNTVIEARFDELLDGSYVSDGGGLNVTAEIMNRDGERGYDYTACIAFYGNGRFLEARRFYGNISAAPNGTVTVRHSVRFGGDGGDVDTVKIFLWDGAESMEPMERTFIISPEL